MTFRLARLKWTLVEPSGAIRTPSVAPGRRSRFEDGGSEPSACGSQRTTESSDLLPLLEATELLLTSMMIFFPCFPPLFRKPQNKQLLLYQFATNSHLIGSKSNLYGTGRIESDPDQLLGGDLLLKPSLPTVMLRSDFFSLQLMGGVMD